MLPMSIARFLRLSCLCLLCSRVQSVMLVELDGARKRTVGVQVVGTQQAAGSS